MLNIAEDVSKTGDPAFRLFARLAVSSVPKQGLLYAPANEGEIAVDPALVVPVGAPGWVPDDWDDALDAAGTTEDAATT